MANIRIDLNHAPLDGETVSFKAPCNASEITGLIAYYLNGSGEEVSQEFTLNDANGNDIGMIDGIFAEGAIVKVILDTDLGNAFVQNPDTNAYLEGRFAAIENMIGSGAAVLPQITVTALTGSVVTCTNGGTVLTAEEVGGTWTFDVPDYGEWLVEADVPDIYPQAGKYTQMVKVDTVKQYRVLLIPENYTMLYYLGDECEALTGGWNVSGNSSKDLDHMTAKAAGDNKDGYAYTAKTIDFSGDKGLFFFFSDLKYTHVKETLYCKAGGDLPFNFRAETYYTTGTVVLAKPLVCDKVASSGKVSLGTYNGGAYSDSVNEFDIYAVGMFKADNWAQLCTLAGVSVPSTLDSLLSDANACAKILASYDAVNYMCIGCTGEFMFKALASSTFKAALAASEFNASVYASDHWAKFLALVA